MTALLCLAFFLSGVSALLFETLWFRQAGLALGNSIWASSLVLAGFMAGLALGNGIAGRFGPRVLQPVRLYGILEIAVGAAGVSLVFLLPALAPWLAPLLRPFLDVPAVLNPLRLGIAFALLLVPSTAMGATLPLLVGALSRRDKRFGRVLGLLYGWNTLGAVVGAVAGEGVFLAWFGVLGTGLAAAGMNAVAAVVAFALAPGLDGVGRGERDEVKRATQVKNVPALLGAAGLAGGILLALEVVWFRFLILFMLPDALAFSLMLGVVLAGIGAGGLAASGWLARRPGAHEMLPWLFVAAGVLAFGTYALFDLAVRPFATRVAFTLPDMLSLAMPLMLPVSLLSGVVFTFLGAALQRESPVETRAAGYLTLANTAGAAGGSLAGGFALLPVLGIERSLQFLAAAYLVTALLAVRPASRARALWIPVAAFVVVAALVPCGLMEHRFLPIPVERIASREGSTLEAAREGLTETIIYLRKEVYGETLYHRLVTNSHAMSSTAATGRRYMKLFVYFPIAVHPEPRSALLISYGVGITAKALTDTAELETIDVVDTSRDILEISRIVHPDPAEHPLNDPRVRVHIEDGRYFLQTTDLRYDVITGEPPPPKAADIVNLFTREYFALLRERLADGGIATYWLPVHSLFEHEAKAIIRAFCEAFSDCSLWAGANLNWNLVGTRGAGAVTEERFRRQWADPVVGPDLRALGFEQPEQLGALFLAGADDLRALTAQTPPLTDDRPKRLGRDPTLPRRLRPVYRTWMNVEKARASFSASEIVGRLWPETLVRESLPWFEVQRLINDFALRGRRGAARELEVAHRLLVTTSLETLPLWYLDRNADSQRAAERAVRRGRFGPGIQTELGIGALSRRDWLAAAEHFERAERFDGAPREATWYRVYALCMADRRDEAGDLALAAGLTSATGSGDAAMWRFLAREFGLTP